MTQKREVNMSTSTLTIQIDHDLRDRAIAYFDKKGMDLSTTICTLLSLEIANEEDNDALYSPSNIASMDRSIKQLEEGKTVTFTLNELKTLSADELEAKANEQRAMRK
jgi:antitoxin component of RelBE/YafQ-DinJ toxin-antitoxin module